MTPDHEKQCERIECPYGLLLQEINERTERIEARLMGNGKPGYEVRLDRLEGLAKFAQRFAWATVIAMIPGGLYIGLRLLQLVMKL